MDFTLTTYSRLIEAFKEAGYNFITFRDYCERRDELKDRFVILRHDVDRKAENALMIAQKDAALGAQSSFYFRVVNQSNRPAVIKAIAALGHEIGYHYEDLSYCQGDVNRAILCFKENLEYFRQFYPVKTICQHGAPRSPYDGRDLWMHYNYRDFGIIGEPYFDVIFSKVFYLTDTGRRWDGFNVSLRDKVLGCQDEWIKMGWVYHSTNDIIAALKEDSFSDQLMLTTHPQRWTDNTIEWTKELIFQTLKNVVKGTMICFK